MSESTNEPTEEPTTPSGVIKRTTSPATTDGIRWEVHLSGVPTAAWLRFFRTSGEPSDSHGVSPQRVVFDRASAVFKSGEDHVESWIASLDRWMAWTCARYALSLEEADLERSTRLDADARQRARIQQLNDRFKNL